MAAAKLTVVMNFLHQAAGHLDQHDPVCTLHAGALHFVVEERILVADEIQARGVLHGEGADVLGEFIRKDGIAKVDYATETGGQGREDKFKDYQPPKAAWQRGVVPDVLIYGVDNEPGDIQQCDGHHRDK